MRDREVLPEVLALVHADDFAFSAHQVVFRVLQDLYAAGDPAGADVVADRLRSRVEELGGYGFFGDLLEAAPTAAHAAYYAKIVLDRSLRRKLITAGTAIIEDAMRPTGPIEQVLASAEKRIFQVAEFGLSEKPVPLGEAMDKAYQRIDKRMAFARGQRLGRTLVCTGYPDLDEILGGFQEADLVVLAARPSLGKTTLAMNMVRHISVDQAVPVFVVSLEQSQVELAERMLCAEARVNTHAVRTGYVQEQQSDALMAVGPLLRSARVWLGYHPTLYALLANARRLAAREKIGLVVIDYLQLIHPDTGLQNRQQEVAQISRSLKQMARDLQVPVLVLSQLNRLSEERADRRPRLSDLRDSGQIEQDADIVMLLHRPEEHGNEVEVSIAKNRNGPVGEIKLYFRKEIGRFENSAHY